VERDAEGKSLGVIDKRGCLEAIPRMPEVILELGCGDRKRHPSAIGVDAIDYDGVDVVGDVFEVLGRIPDGCVDAVYSCHFVEHVPDLHRLICELRRVLKLDGRVKTIAPHFSNPYFYSDYTHRSHFGLYTFSYLAKDRILRRKVPHYAGDTGFDLVEVRLVFKAAPPFYVRHAFRKILELIVNSSVVAQEWYEAGWCYMFPCYEIEYLVVKRR
jgi:SAM-dependent methyltransferase